MKIYDDSYVQPVLKTCDQCEKVLDTSMDLYFSEYCSAIFCNIKCAQKYATTYLQILKTNQDLLEKEGYVIKDE